MATERPDVTPPGTTHFRVAAVERFSLPDPVKQHHIMLRVEYLNPEDRLRGATFELSPEWYLPYRDVIDEAILTQEVYWVDWDYSQTPGYPLRHGDTVAQRLLGAIRDRQIVPEEAGRE